MNENQEFTLRTDSIPNMMGQGELGTLREDLRKSQLLLSPHPCGPEQDGSFSVDTGDKENTQLP